MEATAPEKPRFGSPCNGCGLCCAVERCGIAVEYLGAGPGPCPAMVFEDRRFWCGLVRTPHRFLGTPRFGDELLGKEISRLLGVGKGCDADD